LSGADKDDDDDDDEEEDDEDLQKVKQDYLEEVKKFSEFVYSRAFKQLLRVLDTINASVAEQVEQLGDKRKVQRQTESELKRVKQDSLRKKLELKQEEAGLKSFLSAKTTTDQQKKAANKKIVDLSVQVKELEAKEVYLVGELDRMKNNFGKVPNEGVYTQAFQSMDAAVQQYVKAVRDRAREVTRARRDGPLDKLEQEDVDAAADALELVLKRINSDITEYLTYTKTVGSSEAGTPRFLDTSLDVDKENVESSSDLEQYQSRLATFERIRINRFNAIAAALRDIEDVHQEVADSLAKPLSLWASVEAANIGLLYALKIARIGLLFSASFVSTKAFETLYTERMSAKQPDVPDLKWLVASFILFAGLFDFLLIAVCYMVSSILPDKLDSRVISDFAVDTLVAHTMAALSLFPIADIIQDSRYFDYQVHAPRALRLMKQICFSLSSFHALIPYFYLTGPFYIQYKKAIEKE
jgi:hypothetical protein